MQTLSINRIILFIVSLAMFIEAIDSTIINTAIPAIAQSLQTNPINLKITLIGYLLSLAVFTPISGWIADKFGVKKVFTIALIIFTLSSAWCGLAQNLIELCIARVIQGIGGALTIPVGRLLIFRNTAKNERIQAMNKVVMIVALGPMLGPPIGGLITHYLSWHWIFWVNVPIGIITILLASCWLEAEPPIPVPPLDKIGFALFGLSLAGLTFGLSAFSESTLNANFGIIVIIISLLLLWFYYQHSRYQKYPIVNTELFHYRTFRISITGNFLMRICFGGIPFLLPLVLQINLGYSPQLAGLLMSPLALGVFATKTFSRQLLNKFGFKRVLIVNTILAAFTISALALLNHHTNIYIILLMVFIYGLLMSLQYSSMSPLAYAELDDKLLNYATSIMSTNQQLAQSFGVAVSALLLHYFSSHWYNGNLDIMTFKYTFLILGCLTLLMTVRFFSLQRQDGKELLR